MAIRPPAMHQAFSVSGSSMMATLQRQSLLSGYLTTASEIKRTLILLILFSQGWFVSSFLFVFSLRIGLILAFLDSTKADLGDTIINCDRPVGLVEQAVKMEVRTNSSSHG